MNFLGNSLSFDFLSAILFYVLVLVFIYFNRKKFESQAKIIFLYKTKKGIKLMEKLAKKYSFLITLTASVGVIVGIYFMIQIPLLLYERLIADIGRALTGGELAQTVGVFLPGIRTSSQFFVPFWYGIISLVVCVVIHEGAHGIASLAEGVKIDKTGFGFLLFLPLFFVEPNEKSLKKKSKMTRARIAAAGPFSNILTVILLVGLSLFVLNPINQTLFEESGVIISSVENGLPANLSGISDGEIIVGVNNVKTLNTVSFSKELSKLSVGDEVNLINSEGEVFSLTTTKNPSNESKSYIGVLISGTNYEKSSLGQSLGFLTTVFTMLLTLVFWISFISFNLGILNFLPVWLVDGSHIFHSLAGIFFENEKTADMITLTAFTITSAILLLTIFLPIII